MKVRYTATALRELDELLAYIADRNTTAAASIRARVEALVEQLSNFPFLAQETELKGIRSVPLGSYPYNIFYTVEADEIVILRIRHGARRPLWE
jgi:toxin ParE1/3/4